jgi:hypothetical protein
MGCRKVKRLEKLAGKLGWEYKGICDGGWKDSDEVNKLGLWEGETQNNVW